MARSFSSGDYLEVASNSAFDLSVGSIAFWVNTSQSANYISLFHRGDAAASFNGISLFLDLVTSALYCQLKDGGAGDAWSQVGTTNVRDGAWHHIGLVFRQASGGQNRIYVDGAQEGAGTNSKVWAFSSQVLRWAKSLDSFWTPFVGRQAECGIWNAELTANEFKALALGVLPWRVRNANLVSYVPMHGLDSPERDFVAQRNATLSGTARANHSPVSIWSPKIPFDASSIGDGGGTTRGMPFGHRGSAFNGGRTFQGIIQ